MIQIEHLSFTYPEQEVQVLRDVSLTVGKGEFVVLCGPSGCGKSTLLRQLKTVMVPHGHREGRVLVDGKELDGLDLRTQSASIGFVQQSPDNQIVTDKVWHELAFGLESLGYDTPTIRRRVAEMASFFGIEEWFYKNVAELSGGQKQLLNLASIMAMQPSVLILDEPTSQLDPIAASEFLATVGRINRELGITVLLTEHRLEEVFPLATRVAVMDEGRLLCTGLPTEVGAKLKEKGHSMFLAMPAPMRVWAAVESGMPCPVTVREGREWLTAYGRSRPLQTPPEERIPRSGPETVIEAEELWFKYEKDSPDVVKGLTLTVKKGEFLALLGGNGTGKTTSLKLISGLRKAYRGSVRVNGSLGVLPQDPQTLFVKKTIREDLAEMLKGRKLPAEEEKCRLTEVIRLCRLEKLLDRHPYDLSGGEQQRAALAKTLLLDPEILLLDEPTKGLDAEFKQALAEILCRLICGGVTIIMVSHDVEFCARYAHRCALFFDGSIVAEASPRQFFSGNNFYTTSANRMSRELMPGLVTAEDLIFACGGEIPPASVREELLSSAVEVEPRKETVKLPLWRKLVAAAAGAVAAAGVLWAVLRTDLTGLVGAGGTTEQGRVQLMASLVVIFSLFVLAAAISGRSARPVLYDVPRKQKLARRTVAATVAIVLLIPLTLYSGELLFGGRKFYLTSLLVLLECMLPFFLVFEGRKPQARELVVIAVLVAIGVAGRAAFFMLPQFKPVLAMVIVSGVAMGGETGFLVGATTMLVSGMLLGQGVWTPWQMFSAGIIGWLAGVLFRKGLLRRSRGALCVFGAISAVVLYGGVMNLSSALTGGTALTWELILPYLVTGFPMDCIHGAATAFFLWVAAEPMLEKLDRIKVKYGLVE